MSRKIKTLHKKLKIEYLKNRLELLNKKCDICNTEYEQDKNSDSGLINLGKCSALNDLISEIYKELFLLEKTKRQRERISKNINNILSGLKE